MAVAGVYLGHVWGTTLSIDESDIEDLIELTSLLGNFGNPATHGTAEQRTTFALGGFVAGVNAYSTGTDFDAIEICGGT